MFAETEVHPKLVDIVQNARCHAICLLLCFEIRFLFTSAPLSNRIKPNKTIFPTKCENIGCIARLVKPNFAEFPVPTNDTYSQIT